MENYELIKQQLNVGTNKSYERFGKGVLLKRDNI